MNCRATLSAHLPPRPPSWLHSPTSQGSGNCSVQPRASQNHSQQSRRLTASPPRPSGPESPPFTPLPASVSRARTSFFVVDLVLFCFGFFFPSLHSPGDSQRLHSATKGHRRDRARAGTWDFANLSLQPPPSCRGSPCVIYLFISHGSTPPKLLLPTGEDEKRLQTMEDGGLPHGPLSLIFFNSFYIEPNDTVCF